MTPQQIIERLGLRPHPEEGGYFRETYRSALSLPPGALPQAYRGARSAATGIFYLLTPQSYSKLHRLPGDEIFHHYCGDTVEMLLLHADGRSETVHLGNDLLAGQT